MNFYKITGENATLLADKEVLWVEEDTFFIQSETKLSKPFVKVSTLPTACIESREGALKAAKESKKAELNNACDANLLSFESDALGETHTYDAELEDQLNLMGLVIAGVDSFYRCYKTDTNGEIVGFKENKAHTAAQLKKVYADGSTKKLTQIAKCGQLKALVDNAISVEEVQKIAWE